MQWSSKSGTNQIVTWPAGATKELGTSKFYTQEKSMFLGVQVGLQLLIKVRPLTLHVASS